MPRSGCRISSTKISSETGTTGESACFQRCSTLRRRARTCAPHSVSAILTPSDGCSENGPNANQAREPPRRAPIPGMRTATSSTIPSSSIGAASIRSFCGGMRSPAQNRSKPERAEHELLDEHRVRRPVGRVALDRRGREHHDQPEQRQQAEDAENEVQRGQRAAQPLGERGRAAAQGHGAGAGEQPGRRLRRTAAGRARRGPLVVPRPAPALRPASRPHPPRPHSSTFDAGRRRWSRAGPDPGRDPVRTARQAPATAAANARPRSA